MEVGFIAICAISAYHQ